MYHKFDPIRIERDSMLLIRSRDQQTNQPAYGRDWLMSSGIEQACLLLDQIKREKGVWWMPWQ
ncbi:hypothetical protein NBRC116586_36390 [Pseudooceanicola nitratireducens]